MMKVRYIAIGVIVIVAIVIGCAFDIGVYRDFRRHF